MSEQKRLTSEERRYAIEAVAAVLRTLPEGIEDEAVVDVAEAALRQAVRSHVVIQSQSVRTYRMVTLRIGGSRC